MPNRTEIAAFRRSLNTAQEQHKAIVSAIMAPRKLKLEGTREGLFPRVQEGDRLEVEVKLTAQRSISTFTLEERLPERLGTQVRVPVTRLAAGGDVSHHYGLRAVRRLAALGPVPAVYAVSHLAVAVCSAVLIVEHLFVPSDWAGGCAMVALTTFVVLLMSRPALDIPGMFPELRRLPPVFRWFAAT